MPTIDLTNDEHAAVTGAIRRTIEEDRFLTPAPRSAALGAGEARSAYDAAASPRRQARAAITWFRG
jgi:hypothetical protein